MASACRWCGRGEGHVTRLATTPVRGGQSTHPAAAARRARAIRSADASRFAACRLDDVHDGKARRGRTLGIDPGDHHARRGGPGYSAEGSDCDFETEPANRVRLSREQIVHRPQDGFARDDGALSCRGR